MQKSISGWTIGVIAFAIAATADAAPYSVTYNDTISSASIELNGVINTGESASVKLVLDNGNASVANQTWSAASVQCVIFTFNNAQDRFVAINYAGAPFTSSTTGNFTTDGAGNLQAATIAWEDFSDSITNPFVTNITGTTAISEWFLNGANNVIELNNGPVSYTNVVNDAQVTNWSTPVPAPGVCASVFAPQAQATPVPMPTLTEWGLAFLSILMGGAAVLGMRRNRA